MEIKNFIHAFIIGSSLLSTIISHSYIGFANMKMKGIQHYEIVAIGIPLLFGLFNIVHYITVKKTKNNLYSILFGTLFGLILSIIGRFGMDLPVKIFGFSRKNEYQVHIHAIILYSMIFYFIIRNLNKYFI